MWRFVACPSCRMMGFDVKQDERSGEILIECRSCQAVLLRSEPPETLQTQGAGGRAAAIMTMYLDALARRIYDATGGMDDLGAHDLLLYRLYALLLGSKGTAVSAADVHDAWAIWAAVDRPDHPCLVPFYQLSPEKQMLDEPYARTIRAIAREGG